MNKSEFLIKLESHLMSIPKAEREAAIKYYEDYFYDAGLENEASVIAELGSPEKIAESIKSDYYNSNHFSENVKDEVNAQEGTDTHEGSARKSDTQENNAWENHTQQSNASYDNTSSSGNTASNTQASSRQPLPPWLIILIVVIAVPVGFPLLMGILGTVFGLLVAIASVFFSFIVASFAILIAGIALLVSGIVILFASPASGLLLSGTGLILSGVGFLLCILTFKLIIKVLPALIRWFVDVCKLPFRKRGVVI